MAQVEGKRFPAHRLILMERCEHFRNLLKMNSQGDIVLDGMNSQMFPHILRYIYTGDWSYFVPSHFGVILRCDLMEWLISIAAE